MAKHWSNTHQDGPKPKLIQNVIRSYKFALERQVDEAVRIQMRHNVLNSVGTFNKCKLTRLVIDSDWDSGVWKENWTKHGQEEVLAEDPRKQRSMEPSDMLPAKKKRKALELNDIAWGRGGEASEKRDDSIPEIGSGHLVQQNSPRLSHCKGETWR